MRRWMTAILACALILAAAGCAQGEPVVKTTIEKTPLDTSGISRETVAATSYMACCLSW